MDKLKNWIKRPVNFNFTSVAAISLLFISIAVTGYIMCLSAETELSEIKNDIDRISSQEEIDDVGGYGLIAESLIYGFGKIGSTLFFGFIVCLPIIISVIIAIFAVISRVVYSAENRKRIIAYRIISGLNYFFIFVSALLYTLIFFDYAVTIILALLIALALIINIRNTYSKKIFIE